MTDVNGLAGRASDAPLLSSRRIGAVCLVLLLAAVPALALWSCGGASEPRIRVVPTPLTDISGISWDGGALWITIDGTGAIHRVDPATGSVERTLRAPAHDTGGSAWLDGELYQLAYLEKRIYRIDPASGVVLGSFPSPGDGMCSGMTSDGRYLWVVNWEDERIYKADPRREGRVLESYEADFETTGLAWDGRYLWNGVLVGTTVDHDEETPYTGFVQQTDPPRRVTHRVLPLPGVFGGTSDWLPGAPRATRMWWYDGYHDRLVEIRLPDRARVPLLAAVLWAVTVAGAFAAGRLLGRSRAGRNA